MAGLREDLHVEIRHGKESFRGSTTLWRVVMDHVGQGDSEKTVAHSIIVRFKKAWIR